MMAYKRERSKTAGDIFFDDNTKAGEYTSSRMRSLSLSPRIEKTKMPAEQPTTEDSYVFQIPSIDVDAEYTRRERRSRSNTLIDDIDLSLYKDVVIETVEENDSGNNMNKKKTSKNKDGSIGTLTGFLHYNRKDHCLKICCQTFSLHRQPFENFVYFTNNNKFSLEEKISVEILQSKNSSRRKISLFKSNSKTIYDITWNEEQIIRFKSKHPSEYILKFTISHEQHSKYNEDLTVGYAFVPMKKLLGNDKYYMEFEETVFPYAKNVISPNNQRVKNGEINATFTWNNQINLFEIELKKLNNLNVNNSKDKQIYMKIIVYAGGMNHTEVVSSVYRATNHVITMKEKYLVEIKEKQMRQSFISLQVYEKHLLHSVCMSKTHVSPYMLPASSTLSDSTAASCWEKILMFPYQTVEYVGDLYST